MTDGTFAGHSPRKIAVILPYAVSIRDFVNSGTLEVIANNPSFAVTIYTLNPDLPELAGARAAGVAIENFTPYKDSRIEALLKHLYLYCFKDHFAVVAQAVAGHPVRRAFATGLVGLRQGLGTRRFLALFEKVMLAVNRCRRLPEQLQEQPDLVIGTRSLLNSIDYGLVAEARSRLIPILILASSWDNFTTKGFFPFKARRILVWNAKMKNELDNIFKVPGDQVVISGYPRQSILRRMSAGMDAAEYLAGLGHGAFKRFVLYSASYSALTLVDGDPYPLEYQIMADVSRRLEQVLPEDVCILLRLHPFSDLGGTAAFEGLSRSFVFVPGRKDKYVERVMGPEDEADLARQIALSECVVSMASTMTIDALSLGRPVINTRFDPRPGLPFLQSITRFYEYDHFRDLMRIVHLPIADRPEDVVDFVVRAIDGRLGSPADMAAFEAQYVPASSETYTENVVRVIEDCLTCT